MKIIVYECTIPLDLDQPQRLSVNLPGSFYLVANSLSKLPLQDPRMELVRHFLNDNVRESHTYFLLPAALQNLLIAQEFWPWEDEKLASAEGSAQSNMRQLKQAILDISAQADQVTSEDSVRFISFCDYIPPQLMKPSSQQAEESGGLMKFLLTEGYFTLAVGFAGLLALLSWGMPSALSVKIKQIPTMLKSAETSLQTGSTEETRYWAEDRILPIEKEAEREQHELDKTTREQFDRARAWQEAVLEVEAARAWVKKPPDPDKPPSSNNQQVLEGLRTRTEGLTPTSTNPLTLQILRIEQAQVTQIDLSWIQQLSPAEYDKLYAYQQGTEWVVSYGEFSPNWEGDPLPASIKKWIKKQWQKTTLREKGEGTLGELGFTRLEEIALIEKVNAVSSTRIDPSTVLYLPLDLPPDTSSNNIKWCRFSELKRGRSCR